jgi:hypothetical protein
MSDELTAVELDLLRWLGEEDYSQYGECHGATLDSLVAKGLARIYLPGDHQEGFISQGTGKMYRAVSLTDAGRERLKHKGDDGESEL